MKAYVDLSGVLKLVPENSTEQFALNHWVSIAMKNNPTDEESMPYLSHSRIGFDWLKEQDAP